MKRDALVETDRDVLKRANVITQLLNITFAALTNKSKVVSNIQK